MAKPVLLSLSLCLLVLFNGSLATDDQNQEYRRSEGQRRSSEGRSRYWEGQRRYQECQLDRLDALEPTNRIEAEGGIIESWDPNHQQMQCAGVGVYRFIIDPNGLLLPQYFNAPRLMYIERGRGIKGVVLPGCPETYQESQQTRQDFPERHQKIREVRAGDVFAVPAGAVHWAYNDGGEKLVVVVVVDVSNHANQLDLFPRSFYLAGNPEEEFQQRGQGLQRREHGGKRDSRNKNNIFSGFDSRFLTEVLDINEETARKLRGEDDYRSNIIKVEGRLEVIRPPGSRSRREGREGEGLEREWEAAEARERERERDRRGSRYNSENGMDETICSMRLRENIGDASRADIFTPRAGRISTANSHRLPVLRWLQLSAERGVLYRNAIYTPHWNQNAHSVIFVTRGRARIQVVDDWGRTVFDGELRERQLLVVPQGFALVKRASSEGFEWISFKTNDQAMTNPLVGRTSSFRAFPVEVIANALRITTDEAFRLKFRREEMTLLPPTTRASGRRYDGVEVM